MSLIFLELAKVDLKINEHYLFLEKLRNVNQFNFGMKFSVYQIQYLIKKLVEQHSNLILILK